MTEQADWVEPWSAGALVRSAPFTPAAPATSESGKQYPLRDAADAERYLALPLPEIGGDVIAPGAMYDGNRFLVSPQPYCPYLPTEGVTPDGPIVQADVPRLTSDTGYRAEFAANAFAIPAVGVYDPTQKCGFLIGVEVDGVWGVTGINLQTLPGAPVRVEICLPVMRKRRYRFCDWIDVDNEPGMALEPGAPVRCELRILPVAAESIPAFVSRVAEYGHAHRGREARRFSPPGQTRRSATSMPW
jgi:hypothetical protein